MLVDIPAKNCTISSLLQPKGRPRSLTRPSPAVSGQLGPVCFKTQSISTLLDLKTETIQHSLSTRSRHSRRFFTLLSATLTFHVTVPHGFSVLLHGNLQIFLAFELDKRFSARPPFPRVGEVYARAVVRDLTFCNTGEARRLNLHRNEIFASSARFPFYLRRISGLHLQNRTKATLSLAPQTPLHLPCLTQSGGNGTDLLRLAVQAGTN